MGNIKTLAKTLLTIGAFVFVAAPALAQPGDIRPPTDVTIPSVIQTLTGLIGPLVLIVLLIMLIYGGFVRMTAAGDAEKEKQSTQILSAAIAGFVIIALAPLIINLLSQILGVDARI